MNCEFDGYPVRSDGTCRACTLYNAAVYAQKAAAESFAANMFPGATGAWLSEFGIFAFVDGVATQIGDPAESSAFVALATAVNVVSKKRLQAVEELER